MNPPRQALPSKPFVIAHRGASHDANENSASAIQRALSIGVAAIEVDVHRTKDGVIVVHHDEDLARSCSDPRRIRDLDHTALATLRQRFHPEWEAEPILTLEAAHALAAPLPLVIEIKAGDADLAGFATAVFDFLASRGDDKSVVVSFEVAVIESLAGRYPPSRFGLIRDTDYGAEGWRDLLNQDGNLAVLSTRAAEPDVVDTVAGSGKTVFVYAIDDADGVRAFTRLGARGMISNRPDLALGGLAAS